MSTLGLCQKGLGGLPRLDERHLVEERATFAESTSDGYVSCGGQIGYGIGTHSSSGYGTDLPARGLPVSRMARGSGVGPDFHVQVCSWARGHLLLLASSIHTSRITAWWSFDRL